MSGEQFGVGEAATMLGLDVTMVRRLCRAGRLGYTNARLGRAWIITRSEIATYLNGPRRRPGRPRLSGPTVRAANE
jgi:excisionase family DNA binding protein